MLLRHGLPGALLGTLCLFVPEMRAFLWEAMAGLLAEPGRYLFTGVLIFGALIAYAWFLDRRVDAAAVGWMFYLLAVSVWEEWLFRLAIPYFGAAQGIELRVVVVASNVAFGALHYFTLRWKWQWCVAVFFGGMALSRQLNEHHDLALIIGIHWIATFINTPRLPGRSGRRQKRRD